MVQAWQEGRSLSLNRGLTSVYRDCITLISLITYHQGVC